MVKGKCAIELYTAEKFLFPNNYLDDAHYNQEHLIDRKDYDIYFILRGDSYKIIETQEHARVLVLIIENITINQRYCIQFDILGSFRVPECNHLNMTLQDDGSALKFEYNEKGVEYLRLYYPEEYVVYKERIDMCGSFWNSIHAKIFVDLHVKADNKIKEEKYELVYIGQSQQDDIFKRLDDHKTLQKVMRDTYRVNSKKEIYIMILSIKAKHYSEFFIPRSEYNDKLKKRDGREKLKTYRKIGNSEINPINVTLDLYFEDSNTKLTLESNLETTKTKAMIIECLFEEEKLNIYAENLADILY